jgi:hypothetical protein
MFARFFISNGKKGKESKIAERPRERVCVKHCGKRKMASAIKPTVGERKKHVIDMCD